MDRALKEAIHVNRLVAVERVAHINPKSRFERKGPWLLVDTGEPEFAAANSATPVTRAAASDISAAIEWFEGSAPSFPFIVRTNADDALRAELGRLGYQPAPSERAMVLEAPRRLPYDGPLSIREVKSGLDIDIYGGVNWPPGLQHVGIAIARTAARLGFMLLLGELDGRPIACSMAVVTDAIVGIYNVGVQEPYRRRGFGAAITWAAVEAGLHAGATTAWLGASEMAYGLYRRLGFVEHFEYLHLELPK